VNSKSASSPTLAFRVISQPQSTGEGCANSIFPALIRVLINFAHSGISSDGAGTMRESPLISLCARNYALFSPAECAEPEVPLRCDSYEGWPSRRRRAGSPWPRRPGPTSIFCRTFAPRGVTRALGFEWPERARKTTQSMATVLKKSDFIALQVRVAVSSWPYQT